MSLIEQLDSIGAIAINMRVNQLLPLSHFEHQGPDSGLVSPHSSGSSPVEKAGFSTRGDCSYGIDTTSERYHITHEEEYDNYVCCDPLGTFLPSHGRMLAFGGPGFSVGLVNPRTGETVRVPVPATDNFSCDDPFKFTTSTIECVHAVGDYQIWVGTDQGTLHVFDFCPVSNRLANHCFVDLKESVTCITSRSISRQKASPQDGAEELVEIVVGSPHGYLVTFQGPVNVSGGLDKPLKVNRQVIRLLPPNSLQASALSPVSSILFVDSRGTTSLWCVCGDKIFILDAVTWRQLKMMDIPKHDPGPDVLQDKNIFSSILLDSEVGIWCSASFSPIVTLWNKEDFSFETQIATCSMKTKDCSMGNVSALDFAHPFLFLGTTGGHVLVFKVTTRHSDEKGGRSLELKFSAGEGLQFDTVVELHTKPTKLTKLLRSSVPSSPTEDGTEILILGRTYQKGGSSLSLVRRLKFSHYSKPANASPNSSSCSSPPFTRHRRLTSSSSRSMSLDLGLPLKLTLAQVSPNSTNFLPLKQ